MGTWGVHIFENDAAMDLVTEVVKGTDLSLIRSVLEQTIPSVGSNSDLDADVACQALVACAVVSALRGYPFGMPDDLEAWLRGKEKPSAELRLIAHSALLRVLNNSELRNLWLETDDFDAWRSTVKDLLKRLSAPKDGIVNAARKVISKGGKLTNYACCFCAESIRSNELLLLTVKKKKGFEQDFYAHALCFENANILFPRGHS